MKLRSRIVIALALVTVAAVILSSQPSRQNPSPPAKPAAVSSDQPGRPHTEDNLGAGASPSPPIQPMAPANAPAGMSASSPGAKASPLPATTPIVVGDRTFVPKLPPPQSEPQAAVELDKVRLMLRDYRTLYHENPVGTNAEIMKAVMGGNPRQAQLGPPEGQSLNASGELLDRWGTPYFFHQLSSNLMEIRSAGPDKTLWTSDDIVTK